MEHREKARLGRGRASWALAACAVSAALGAVGCGSSQSLSVGERFPPDWQHRDIATFGPGVEYSYGGVQAPPAGGGGGTRIRLGSGGLTAEKR